MGSANLLLMRGVSESLAGRASYLTLWPMTRREQLCVGRCGQWDGLLAGDEADWLDLVSSDTTGPEDWRALARRGGFPTPAVAFTTPAERRVWFEGYVRTYLERDLQQLSTISALPDFRRLMRATCVRLGQLVNQTELGRDVGLTQPTVRRYLNLLGTEGRLLPIEIELTSRPRMGDASHLRSFRSEYGDAARSGLLLHTGDSAGWLTPDVLAVPWWRVI